jgi:Uma2 family endonuclease
VADLLKRLGSIPAWRVRLHPAPGTATLRDVLRLNESPSRTAICELVEGTLVEKTVGAEESQIAGLIITFLNNFVLPRRLGVVLGEAGMLRLQPGLARAPDVSFLSHERLSSLGRPLPAVPAAAPDLAVEVVSKGNTRDEMKRKIGEYFAAGTQLVWIVDPRKQAVQVYTALTEAVSLGIADVLDGGETLPGFRLHVRELFGRA